MQAIGIDDGRCHWRDVPAPPLGPGQVRIGVEAAGVNRADLVQKAGRYPPPPGASDILGLEAAGTVIEVGAGVTRWSVGEAVGALLTGGGYASEVVVDAEHVLPRPDGLDAVGTAAIIEAFTTAWLNVFRIPRSLAEANGASAEGPVLIHAGGSGVGTAAVQLCARAGRPCFVTAGHADKIARCEALGADGGANRHDGPWRGAVEAWAPDGVAVVLDPVGAAYFADDLAVLRADGALVQIGLLSGRTADIDLGRLLMKRLRVCGSTLRALPAPRKAALLRELEAEVWPGFADGTLRPIVDRTFPIHDAEAAHAHLASNATFGAVVLTVP